MTLYPLATLIILVCTTHRVASGYRVRYVGLEFMLVLAWVSANILTSLSW